MPRYIDAEKARDNSTDPYVRIYLDSQPTADVAPIVHAHWMGGVGLCSPYCSNCKKYSPNGVRFNYCPHCGARMYEEAEK